MFKAIARLLGRFALFGASAALLVGTSLFLMGAYLLTWPLLRTSPRQRQLTASMNLAAAMMTAIAAFKGDESDEHISESQRTQETG